MVVGEVVGGRYELEELVGSGGMSTVYRAHDRILDRRVAIKILHERLASDEDYLERFRREARAAAQLNHPNIVTVIDRGDDAGRPYIVFEYVDGDTLKSVVERRAPLPVRDAIGIALQVAEALAYAHERGVIHRDVKPQNVLLADGRAKVADFGIARSVDSDVAVTQTGTVLGTSDYMAPEQALGEQSSERSDVYSLGAMLYELLTGVVLFSGESFVAVALKHAAEPPPSVLESRPDCPVRLAAAVDRCLAKDPEERFASMRDVNDELHACLAELDSRGEEDATLIIAPPRRATRARVEPEPEPKRPGPRSRRRVVPWLVLFLAVPALAALVAVLVLERGTIKDAIPLIGSKSVKLKGVGTYDPPPGDGSEHNELVPRATDGDQATFWSTEDYRSWFKPGVGLVLATPDAQQLTELTVHTDTPGFPARIRAGPSKFGPWNYVSKSQTVHRKTTFKLDLHGNSYRYYMIWLQVPNGGTAHINEVTARAK